MMEELCAGPELAGAAVWLRIGILCTSLRGLKRQSWLWASRIQIGMLYRPCWWMLRGNHTRHCES
jgi:hypothetical protein